MKITIELTKEEEFQLKALALRFKTSPKAILKQFASDLTGSWASHGSDEREMAMRYFERGHWDYLNPDIPGEDRLTESEVEKMERLQSQAWRHRNSEETEWRAKFNRTDVK